LRAVTAPSADSPTAAGATTAAGTPGTAVAAAVAGAPREAVAVAAAGAPTTAVAVVTAGAPTAAVDAVATGARTAAVAVVPFGAPTAAVCDDGVAATWGSTAAVGRAAATELSVPTAIAEEAVATVVEAPSGSTGADVGKMNSEGERLGGFSSTTRPTATDEATSTGRPTAEGAMVRGEGQESKRDGERQVGGEGGEERRSR